jgi:C-terminal processing protease CtpA/Prc
MAGAIDAIRGPEGTTVRLTVKRDGATGEVEVPRQLIRG